MFCQNQEIKFLRLACSLAALCFLVACGGRNPNAYLYDKPGFDSGTTPKEHNPNGMVKATPDYYYRQQNPYGAPPQQYQQQPQQQYAPPPPQQYQQVPYPASPYGQQVPPGSRYYSNPYAIPPSQQHYPNYDADQYYVPPAYFNNVEPQSPAGMKNSRAY